MRVLKNSKKTNLINLDRLWTQRNLEKSMDKIRDMHCIHKKNKPWLNWILKHWVLRKFSFYKHLLKNFYRDRKQKKPMQQQVVLSNKSSSSSNLLNLYLNHNKNNSSSNSSNSFSNRNNSSNQNNSNNKNHKHKHNHKHLQQRTQMKICKIILWDFKLRKNSNYSNINNYNSIFSNN